MVKVTKNADLPDRLTKRELFCMYSGVPETGDPDLDDIIRKGREYTVDMRAENSGEPAYNFQVVSVDRPGYEALWLWFELSRASFLTIPRVLLHEMPDEWQGKLAALLNEADDFFPSVPPLEFKVRTVDAEGKRVDIPDWILNYRHPDKNIIDSFKKPVDSPVSTE